VSRLAKRPHADHAAVAATLREAPGEWGPVQAYRSKTSADSAAYWIRTASRLAAYAPAGAFEARVEYVDGEPTVYARYVGTGGLVMDAVPHPTPPVDDDATPGDERPTDWNSRSAQQARHRTTNAPAEMPARSTR
jgi:hypothetical protein